MTSAVKLLQVCPPYIPKGCLLFWHIRDFMTSNQSSRHIARVEIPIPMQNSPFPCFCKIFKLCNQHLQALLWALPTSLINGWTMLPKLTPAWFILSDLLQCFVRHNYQNAASWKKKYFLETKCNGMNHTACSKKSALRSCAPWHPLVLCEQKWPISWNMANPRKKEECSGYCYNIKQSKLKDMYTQLLRTNHMLSSWQPLTRLVKGRKFGAYMLCTWRSSSCI